MHCFGFQDKKVLLQAGYDVIVIYPPGAFHATFHDIFWKSDQDFLTVIHNNFLSAMHGFRDNYKSVCGRLKIQAGYFYNRI